MPYSDNLYSAWDESDSEPIEDGLNQLEPQGSETHLQRSHGGQVEPDWHTGQVVSDASGRGGDGDLDDDEDFLSPTDGYFHSTQNPAETQQSRPFSAPAAATSSNVPHVPNILVEDPSLPQGSTAQSKAREAHQERLASSEQPRQFTSRYPSGSSRIPEPRWDIESRPGPGRDTYHTPSSSTGGSYASYTPHAPQRTAYDESSLLIPREAPPAYTPSPTSSQSPGSDRNYRTFPPNTSITAAMGGRDESETQGLLAYEPQSMGNPDDSNNDTASSWTDRLRSRLRHRSGRHGKVALLAVLLAILTIGFLQAIISSGEGDHSGRHHNSTIPKKEKDLTIIGRPPMDPDDGFEWGAHSNCKDAQVARDAQQFDVSFAANRKLVVYQGLQRKTPSDHVPINVHGSIILRRVTSGTPGPSAVVETVVNDDRINVNINWDANEQALVVEVPHGIPWTEDNTRPCLNLKITVWVPEDGTLNALDVEAVHLDIALMDNLSISISERAKFTSVVGSIIAASTGSTSRDNSVMSIGAPDSFRLQSRFIEVTTTSGVVKGSWPLYDYLAIQTVSGNIKVGVEPQEAAKNEPKPAILYIKSASGDVEFREPIQTAVEAFNVMQALAAANKANDIDLRAETVLPPRDYRLDVHTASGFITGSAAISSTCGIKTTSGDIKLDLLPVLDSSFSQDNGKQAVLRTSSTSGKSKIEVLAPMWIDSQAGKYTPVPRIPAIPPVPGIPNDRERFVPIGDDDPYSWIPGHLPHDGESASSQDVSAHQPRSTASSRAFRALDAEHGTTSGNVQLKYPASWEGTITLQTMAGKLSARGEGVEIISGGGGGWPKRPLLARKGQEKPGSISVGTASGNVDVLVGN
ncbi:hypothetical protein B0T16DRAFT_462916 [Cercophora newfieldiana]|uniref:Adhesin domain-containing protein n=1 Tax=Cercophora newfieldiana TaxID=92897 RepID=A0AA40CI18_9PEZI|nr:hypothetical protein B0T16DRAFT_462916 [Cercophora newfieldiana]